MLKKRVFEKEIIDDLKLSDSLIIENLKDMEFLNRWLGYNRKLVGGIEKVCKKYKWQGKKVRIADLGCGSGDALRSIGNWMRKRKRDCELIGVDGNETIIAYGKERSLIYPEIKYCVGDILSELNYKSYNYDIISLNNICHHFREKEIIHLLKKIKIDQCIAIIINDLHRHWLAYLGIKLLNKIFQFSALTQHDGPLSVRRGFKKRDLERILKSMGKEDYEIRWTWPFRWQIIIWD